MPFTAQQEEPCRYFDSNLLDGTIPDSLSAPKLLHTLCVRPLACRAARRVRLVPLGVGAGRVVHVRVARLRIVRRSVMPRGGHHRSVGGRSYCLRTPR